MTWFKLDDSWDSHPKARAVGLTGRGLWISGGLHCARNLTDGRIEKDIVPVLIATAQVPKTTVKKLVDSGLWIDHGDHYEMHGYLDYQPSKAVVETDRKRWRDHKTRTKADSRSPVDSARSSPVDSTVDSTGDSTVATTRARTLSRLVSSREENKGCTIAAACTTVAEPAAAQAEPALIRAAASIVAERRRTATQALDKRNPAAWEASAMAGIRGDIIAVAAPGLDAEALADLVEPERPEPSPRADPLDRTQAAARALANRDRSCERCHGTSVWLDDDGAAHECDHRAGAAA